MVSQQLVQPVSPIVKRPSIDRENARKQIIDASQALIERVKRLKGQDPNKPKRACKDELHLGKAVIKLSYDGTIFRVSACKNGRPGRADACLTRNVNVATLEDGSAPLPNFLDLIQAHNSNKPA